MSIHVYLFFPPRGHEPPPTLRNCLLPHLSLQRRRLPIPRYAKPPDDVDLSQSVHPFSFPPLQHVAGSCLPLPPNHFARQNLKVDRKKETMGRFF